MCYSEHDSLHRLLVWYDFACGVPNRSSCSCSWKHCSQGPWGTNATIKLQLKKWVIRYHIYSLTEVRITRLTSVRSTDLVCGGAHGAETQFTGQPVLKSDAHTSTQADKIGFFLRVGGLFSLMDKGSVLQEDLKVQLQLLHVGPHLSMCS